MTRDAVQTSNRWTATKFHPSNGPQQTAKKCGEDATAAMPGSGAGDFAEVDLDARAHRRADRDLLDELALGARRLGLEDRVDERREIFLEIGFGEARLADPGVDDPRLLDAELDLARLGVVDRLGDVHGDGAELRV